MMGVVLAATKNVTQLAVYVRLSGLVDVAHRRVYAAHDGHLIRHEVVVDVGFAVVLLMVDMDEGRARCQ